MCIWKTLDLALSHPLPSSQVFWPPTHVHNNQPSYWTCLEKRACTLHKWMFPSAIHHKFLLMTYNCFSAQAEVVVLFPNMLAFHKKEIFWHGEAVSHAFSHLHSEILIGIQIFLVSFVHVLSLSPSLQWHWLYCTPLLKNPSNKISALQQGQFHKHGGDIGW